jgi:hypothetical protein
MRSFKSPEDLTSLPSDHPAYPVLADLVQRLTTFDGYDPEADGWIVLIDEGDIDKPLIWDETTLHDLEWEGVVKLDGFFQGIFLANNQFGVVFLIPDQPWLPAHYRDRLEWYLDP